MKKTVFIRERNYRIWSEKRVDTLGIVSKQRCTRCGRVRLWIGIRKIFLVRGGTADFSSTKLRSRRAQMELTCKFLVWTLKLWRCVWQAIAVRTQTIKEWFIYQTADCRGIKRTYSVRISRFIGVSSAAIMQLCRWPAAFNSLADGAVWLPECPGDWKILLQRTPA